jgi:uroporphyrinogen-III decarboxylase
MMGSEVFGFWLMDERELLREMVDKAYRGIEEQVRHYLSHGIGDCYGWVGPELCIPPLASPRDFREFVFDYDKRIIDMIHDAGGLCWVHCHGKLGPVMKMFVEMGVDCLNPIEPPPMGDISLLKARSRIGDHVALEGNIEQGEFYTATPQRMEQLVQRPSSKADQKAASSSALPPVRGSRPLSIRRQSTTTLPSSRPG